MTGLVPAAVIFSALLHASWNATAHLITDRAVGFALIGLATGSVGAVLVLAAPLPAGRAWPFLAASAAVHVAYNLLLIRSYRLGDFSQMYPLARGTSPLVVAVVAVTVVGQPLSERHAAGVLVICSGLALLAFGGRRARASRAAVTAAVLTGLSIAGYTVLDGVGVRHSGSTVGYIGWLFLLQGPVIVLLVGRGRRPAALLGAARGVWAPGLASGVVSLAAYGIVIWAQTRSNLASVAALRETSILFGALIGLVFFSERFGGWRIAGAAATVAGIVLLNT